MAVILDTNAVSALLAGDPALGEVLAEEPRHHLPVIVIGEYRFGLLGSRYRNHLQSLLEILTRESIVLLVDEGTAESYSHVRDGLRRKGRPIPENDIWIAALARQYHQAVVSRDDHFDYVSDLRRVPW
ncbi:MAG TPA: type II toxin-antitoxin system VapC family toxin [Thermoanaerobaculia bacterium]|jgi:tRNA(fMet)-specific endonuclease VapC|nr:type II toxin-antitoxin system VapC family toxin [Thermoanaerobaculia bacterium]